MKISKKHRIAKNSVLFNYDINLAKPKATAAASPPTTVVWNELFQGDVPVNLAFTYPKTASAISVTMTDTFKPEIGFAIKK